MRGVIGALQKGCWLSAILVMGLAGQGFALDLVKDGSLVEWVGDEINHLGTEPAPEGGTYTLLAAWDGAICLGMDRNSSNRYLGDDGWNDDSFFVAVDVDGIAGSGATMDGYGRMQFAGPMLPEIVYCFAGGSGGYWERCAWNGIGWDWLGWGHNTGDNNMYYGSSESSPNDELDFPLTSDVLNTYASDIAGRNEIHLWAWMTREGSGFVEASWPRGASGFQGQVCGAPITVHTLQTRLSIPHDPVPGLYQDDVDVDSDVVLSWEAAMAPSLADPNVFEVDSNVTDYKVYLSGPFMSEPNAVADRDLAHEMTVAAGAGTTVSATLPDPLAKDAVYFWRVDKVLSDANEVAGDVWMFYTEQTVPTITGITPYQIIEPGTAAAFTISVNSVSPATYQWYKDDGDRLANPTDTLLTDETADTLTVPAADVADEGWYYCVVSNDSGVLRTSALVPLSLRKQIAYWDFEGGSVENKVAGSPAMTVVGDPVFVPNEIMAGNAIEFDAEVDGEDMLYTDPGATDYFDICNYEMTVAVWVKTSDTKQWAPLVARNGEGSQGWQLRQSGFTTDRPCFTTRGTGSDDGTPANRTIYDGQWHYVVATFDSADGVKKVYIDGVVSRTYSTDDGSYDKDGDVVNARISNALNCPVAIAGRVTFSDTEGLIVDRPTVVPGVYDEIELYNYALDTETIAQRYADITGASVCAGIQAYDLNNDCMVNLGDVSAVASEWLNDELIDPGM